MSTPLIPESTVELINKHDSSLVSPPTIHGTRKISLGLLSPPSSASSRSASATSSSTPSSHITRFVTVPTHLESAATFEFLGFTPSKARFLFKRRALRMSQTHCTIEIVQWATDWIEGTCIEAQGSEDDWDATMSQAGVKDDIRQAFSKNEHSQIRLVQPLSDWLVEIVETFYDALVDLNARILQELSPSPPELRGGDEEEYTVPQAPSGHIALFKSVEFRRCQGCFSEDGSLNLGRLESTGPTDFCRRGGLYFTHQLWVATNYSALITDACPVADRRTVELHVPLLHFQIVKLWDLKFESDEYKQLVYYSRRDDKYPKILSEKRKLYGVIYGSIAHCHNLAFGKMEKWQQITNEHQVQLRDDEGIKIGGQYVWISTDAISQLEEDVVGKVFVWTLE